MLPSRTPWTARVAGALVIGLVGGVLGGSASAQAAQAARAASAVAAIDPVNTTPPTVLGKPAIGEVLTADPGTWTPDGAAFTYQWLRAGAPVKDATRQRYRPALGDLGVRLSVQVTATADGSPGVVAESAPTAKVGKGTIENLGRPEIDGVRRYTRVLAATRGSWSRRPDEVRYHWLRDGEPIKGANRRTHHLGLADFGDRISVRVVVVKEGFRRAVADSRRTGPIRHRVALRHTVTYHVETRGRIGADLATFKRQAQQTFDDPRGWRGSGIAFRRVRSGGDFTLVLSEAGRVPGFSSACSSEWSCRVGRYVIINQTRWLRSSPAWHELGRSLRDYRHMVVNHETGHWLGHGHRTCPRPGALAPVMQQQSKGLGGCRANPWPTVAERRTPRFG